MKKQTIENLIENTLTVSFPNGEYEDITEENIASESMSIVMVSDRFPAVKGTHTRTHARAHTHMHAHTQD